jgi:hypothetical protein
VPTTTAPHLKAIRAVVLLCERVFAGKKKGWKKKKKKKTNIRRLASR